MLHSFRSFTMFNASFKCGSVSRNRRKNEKKWRNKHKALMIRKVLNYLNMSSSFIIYNILVVYYTLLYRKNINVIWEKMRNIWLLAFYIYARWQHCKHGIAYSQFLFIPCSRISRTFSLILKRWSLNFDEVPCAIY